MILSFRLHTTLIQSVDDILNSVDEDVKESEGWVEPEEPGYNFITAKAQQDEMKVRNNV